jgi:hypothetical protein
LTEFQCGYSDFRDFSTGWAINFRSAAFENVTQTVSNCQIGYAVSSNTANSVVLRDGSGNFSAGTIDAVDFNSTSDRALKENFLPIENALNKVKQLTGWTYNFKSDTNKKRHAGIVAQDLLEILPEAVTGEPGNYKVAYSNIIGLLVEAIKEQQKQIEQLLKKE